VARTSKAGQQADPDVLTTDQLAERLGISDRQTLRSLAASGVVPGWRVGREWRYSWKEVYEWIAGSGVPDGELVTAEELARRLGVSAKSVRSSAAAPGTPGSVPGAATLPGRLVGGHWRFAVEAVWLALPETSPGLAARLGVRPGGEDAPAG
jgi:excisionase family DNA binding protein